MDANRAALADVQRARTSGVLRALPRRDKLAIHQAGPVGIQLRQLDLPKSRLIFLMWRSWQWMLAIHLYMMGRIADTILRRRSLTQKGVRLRQLFERVGGTGLKIGQQLAVRADYFPYEICAELSKLNDRVPPFPLATGLPRLQAATGGQITEVFEHIDAKPIGSASLGCVFKGKLRTGEDVAIKIRRPGVERYFMGDLAIVGFLLWSIEFFTLVRPGFFSVFHSDLKSMLLEELDFVQEANYQEMYRKYIKWDRIRWLHTPRVFHHLSSHDVLISEFVHGFSCTELIRAVESREPAALARFAEANIQPEIVAERILDLGFWSFFECPFFQGDPHPGNIILLPDNEICMLDFGACGISSPKQRAIGIELNKRMLEHDAGGVTNIAMAAMEPLPYVNTDELRKAGKVAFKDRMINLSTKDAEWWERTTAAIWLSLIDATRRFAIPVTMDLLRMTRATMLYDTLVARLKPDVDILQEFKGWERRAIKRTRRRREREAEREARPWFASTVERLDTLQGTLRRGLYWANEMTAKLPRQFMVASKTGAFIASSLLRVALGASLLTTLAVAYVLLQSGFPRTLDRLLDVVQHVVRQPLVIGAMAVVAWSSLRSIRDRLKDQDLQG